MGKPKKERKIIHDVAITDMSSEGMGIGRIEGKVVFATRAVPGDVVDVEVHKSKKSWAEGEIVALKTPSDLRIPAPCQHFGVCGGCKWQHIGYDEQLKFKKKIVTDAFERIGKIDFPEMPDVLGCTENFFYRNKLEFAFTDRRWLTVEEINSGADFGHRNALGFHVPGSFSGVIDIQKCWLQGDPSNAIRLAVKQFALDNGYTFFNLKDQNGLLRNLMVRTTSIGELLVLVSFYEDDKEKREALLNHIYELFPQITSLQYVVNSKRNDTIYDQELQVYKGRDYIIEQLGQYKYKIGAKSFFQTNSTQAKNLYDITKEFAGLKPTDVVYDLYTGVGSIAIYVSGDCKSVTGIEQIEAAIVDAKENAKLNEVTNCTFYAGDVRMVLKDEFIAANGKPDVVITDPPRAGMHEDVVKTLLQLAAPKIVYVSCNAATQARDLQLLSEKYNVTRVQPVDMFPHTTHIENVALLELR
ncbi:MAG TPA: 23S rRNA (uracil(1939)-C(5))-methyltransferase RlmD [Chitinophagales bacterium]|nr:23S rRNA (uracil(1939)-C(5))-methyltransferase RlmD [Chitinophagales bacterium]